MITDFGELHVIKPTKVMPDDSNIQTGNGYTLKQSAVIVETLLETMKRTPWHRYRRLKLDPGCCRLPTA